MFAGDQGSSQCQQTTTLTSISAATFLFAASRKTSHSSKQLSGPCATCHSESRKLTVVKDLSPPERFRGAVICVDPSAPEGALLLCIWVLFSTKQVNDSIVTYIHSKFLALPVKLKLPSEVLITFADMSEKGHHSMRSNSVFPVIPLTLSMFESYSPSLPSPCLSSQTQSPVS
jgi:hypothetical protein